jgi:hypothetical protein
MATLQKPVHAAQHAGVMYKTSLKGSQPVRLQE